MDETEIDLWSIIGLLRRQLRLIVATVVVVVGIAAIVAYTLTPIYSASTLVMVDPTSKNLLDPTAQLTSASADNARVEGEVEIARSDNVLVKVIQRENLINDREFGVSVGVLARVLTFFGMEPPEPPSGAEAFEQTLSKLRSAVSVQRRGNAYLLSIQARSSSAELAARLANAVAETYIVDQLASKVQSTVSSLSVLQGRIDQARNAVVASENTYDSVIADNIAEITSSGGRADLAQMQRQIDELEAARARNNTLAGTVQSALASDNIDTIVASLQSDAVNTLEQQRQRLRRDIASGTTAAEVDLRAELARIEDEIRTQAGTEVSQLRSSIQSSQAEAEALRQNLRSSVIDSALPADALAQIFELQQSAELARRQYQILLARAQDLEAQADLQMADSRIVSPALTPQSPTFPNKTLILALAGIGGLGLGIGLAFLYENLIGGFTSEDQVVAVLGTPVAASIPYQQVSNDLESLANLVVKSPLSVFSETVRRTRASVDQTIRRSLAGSENAGRGKVIMVTSTNPNEGKTTLSLSLARSYSLSGQRVLLIDCDLRRPSIHRHLGLAPSLGLLEILQAGNQTEKMADLIKMVATDPMTSVTVVPGARGSEVPTDQLLANPVFARFISAARATFDYVILDTPPMAAVVDANYIAQQADLVVFVTKWASTAQRDAKRSVDALKESVGPDTAVLAVLMQNHESGPSYYRKYGSYYGDSA